MPKEKAVQPARGTSVSNHEQQPNEQQSTAVATQAQNMKVETSPTGDVSGPLDLALSQGMRDELVRELLESIARVKEGFGTLVKPGTLYDQGRSFHVIEAFTVNNFVDRDTGEIRTKHLFKLQFDEGDVATIMQSDTGPRGELAGLFTRARALGGKIMAGPYKFETKDTKRPNPAFIFVQQPGFDIVAVS
jgi:hypothetical protein